MLVAKDGKNVIKNWLLSENDYNTIVEKAWVEWGLWHKYYEEYRKLNENIPEEKEKMDKLEKISQEYYKKFNP